MCSQLHYGRLCAHYAGNDGSGGHDSGPESVYTLMVELTGWAGELDVYVLLGEKSQEWHHCLDQTPGEIGLPLNFSEKY